MWRGIKACQKKKRPLYKSYYVISAGSRWGEQCSFLSLTSKGSVKLGKHPLSFSTGPDWPWQPCAGIPDSDRWGSVSRRWEGVEGSGWGSPREGMAATPGRNSDSLASACCQSVLATPWPGGSLCEYTFSHLDKYRDRPGKAAHPSLPLFPIHLLLPLTALHPPHPRALYLGHHRLPSDPPVLLFLHFLIPLFATSPQLAVYIYSVCLTLASQKKNIICYIMDACTWPFIYLVLFSQLLVRMVNVCI